MTGPELLGVPGASAGERLDPYAERILDAAREQLARFGLRRTSMEDVAGHAGVGRATLYRRFPNRESLLAALVQREVHGVIAGVDEHISTRDSPQERLVHGFLAFIAQLRGNDLLRNLLVTDPELVLPTLTDPSTLALGRAYIAAHATRARDEGAALTAEPEVIAELLARFAHSLALSPDSILPLDDDEQLARLARATLAPLIFAP
jgi:AcrR family transcriptional regulator